MAEQSQCALKPHFNIESSRQLSASHSVKISLKTPEVHENCFNYKNKLIASIFIKYIFLRFSVALYKKSILIVTYMSINPYYILIVKCYHIF